MADSPFGSANDILLCCRFAEGDSRVLQQMLVRDLLRAHRRPRAMIGLASRVVWAWLSGAMRSPAKLSYLRDQHLLRLMWVLRRHMREARSSGVPKSTAKTDAWLRAGDLVYDVAKAHAQHLIYSTVTEHFGRSADTEVFCGISASDCQFCNAF